MRKVNELTIHGNSEQLARLLETFEQPLADGWRRYVEAESRWIGMGRRLGSTRCFACSAEGSRPAAAVWLESRGGDTLIVSNIVRLGKGGLFDDEYNHLLADFDSQVLQPACDGLAIQTELTPYRVKPEVYLSYEGVRRLKAFSDSANKSSLHHTECQRWREFSIQSYCEGAGFDPSLLDEWLAEQGWPEDQRQHLMREYENTLSILAAYDEERLAKCLP